LSSKKALVIQLSLLTRMLMAPLLGAAEITLAAVLASGLPDADAVLFFRIRAARAGAAGALCAAKDARPHHEKAHHEKASQAFFL
jgi:hypothetical protein